MAEERHDIPEELACLACACEDPRNRAARRQLLRRTNALSATGVLAAIVMADGEERAEIVAIARNVIREQREICREQWPFKADRCGDDGRAVLRRA